MSQWDEKEVFLRALGLPEEQREAFLRQACPDESSVERVATLLRHHHEASDDFLEGRTQTTAPPGQPQQIGEFKILHRLGEGGMGIVYLAEDTTLGRRVALKVLARHLSGSEQALARFREEARSAASLKHPAIVPVFRFSQDEHGLYLVSELVEGPTLATVIAEQRQALRESGAAGDRDWYRRAAEIIAVIADALDCAHRAGIIHRDVKPSNILLDKDRGPRLTDFGIAKHLTEENRTRHSGVIGTVQYMSPEQAAIADTQVDQRSDIFSLGVVLYEMLALRLPFSGKSMQKVLQAVIHCEPPRLRTINRRITSDLETICHKAIEKKPVDRYQTAAHVAADLRCFLRGDPILAVPPSFMRRIRRKIVANRARSVVVLIVVLAATIASLTWFQVAAWRAARTLVHLSADGTDHRVFLQRISDGSYELQKPIRLSDGTTEFYALPGPCRITVVQPDGAFAEIDEYFSRGAVALSVTPRLPKDVASDMILFDEGDYWVGAGDYPNRKKRHVHLPAFYLDCKEVSNAEYLAFARASNHPKPWHWTEFGYDDALADRPVVGIEWRDAQAFARWQGKRLPTAIEWEAAARAPDGRRYPTTQLASPLPDAAQPDCDAIRLAQSDDPAVWLSNYGRFTVSTAVGQPATSCGRLLHMFGNAREFTSSVETALGAVVIVKGRCWLDSPDVINLASAWSQPMSRYSIKTGFRCAKSAQPPME